MSETLRLAELESYEIMDTEAESAYDDIVALAGQICDTPIALISLVDSNRQWFKAKIGLEAQGTPREHAFCAHAVENDATLIVPDASDDERFKNNPLVRGDPNIRFYAGAPLRSGKGAPLGTLCVIDRQARQLSGEQIKSLETLARHVETQMELRRQVRVSERMSAAQHERAEALAKSEEQLRLTVAASQAGIWDWDLRTKTVNFSDRWKSLLGFRPEEISDSENEWRDRIHPQDVDEVLAWAAEGLSHAGVPFHRVYRMQHKDGHYLWFSVRAVAVHNENGEPVRAVGSALDVTDRKLAEDELVARRAELGKVLDRCLAMTGIMDADGTLRETNEIARNAAGLTRTETIGVHITDTYWFAHSDDVQQQLRAATEAAANGNDVRFDCDIRVGEYKFQTIDLSVRPVFDTDGKVEFLVLSAIDITDRKRAEEALFQAKERAEITLQSIGDGVITTNEAGLVVSINASGASILNRAEATVLGRPIDEVLPLIDTESREPVENAVLACLRTQGKVDSDRNVVLKRGTGEEIAIYESATTITTSNGETIGVVLIFRDVTKERERVMRVVEQASQDALTGLPNRREFERRARLMLDAAYKHGSVHALCFIDLDAFKAVNDNHGHAAGDELLRQLGRIVKKKIRARDTLARLGGDEFGLLLGNCPLDRATEIAIGLKDAICDFEFLWEGNKLRVGASIGVTEFSSRSRDVDSVLRMADSACYKAKRGGRNRVEVFEENQPPIVSADAAVH